MPTPKTLQGRIYSQEPQSLTGHFYRLVHQRYRNDILSTQGSLQYGGRYNPPSVFGALYLAESEQLAQIEVLRAIGDPSMLAATFVCGEIEVQLHRVLDLTDSKVLKALGIQRKALLADTGDHQRDYVLTRQIAQLARAVGFEGLRVPSATSQGTNLVVFPENLPEADQLHLHQVRDTNWKTED